MMTGAICLSILQFSRCRIKSSPSFFRSAYIASHNFHTLRHSSGCGSELLCGSNGCRTLLRATKLSQILQPISTRTGKRATDIKNTKKGNLQHGKPQASIASPVSSSFRSIEYNDARDKIVECQDKKHLVRVFAIDTETTGFCKERSRIIEFAIRDLSGGNNSYFQTLVNPEQSVPNSHIHGITTEMVNRPDVPRMKDLIPILVQYVKSRLMPGGIALFVAHNGRTFDIPFLCKEFSRCSMNIPSDWQFLDTLPLARKFMEANGLPSQKCSLQALRECLDIPVGDTSHRAMSDVNVLSSLLGRLTFEMKLTVADLIERSFKASDLIKPKKASDPIKSKKIKTKV
ncbi:hypothetical protein SLEP1_g66 [Rubroshorea leprosula]|uniref:Exonuclease domain-containing protein n=1 Tax=Rubroshorea leprosula TaxID=152421 RepID=A0AAV5H950_9ROSI|nr:hypothetical protein SLEP1_g66 [Rubroshorea leprosula]